MVMDTLRAAVRHLAAPPLNRAGRRLSGRRDRPVCAEPHSGWDYRRLCSGLAADRGGVVYIYSYSQIVWYKKRA
jgi:hypothetical protein